MILSSSSFFILSLLKVYFKDILVGIDLSNLLYLLTNPICLYFCSKNIIK